MIQTIYYLLLITFMVSKESYIYIYIYILILLVFIMKIVEIFAATEAGYQVVISDRPGNAPLGPESKQFKIVTSFDQI
jgi:methionine salvage enolase-phosphatase E1